MRRPRRRRCLPRKPWRRRRPRRRAADLLEGGCVCGGVRYRLAAEPFDAGYCHCRLCQHSSGAPVLAFATVPRAAFVITAGEPRRRVSTSFGERWFCGDCGTQLAIQVETEPDTIDFTIDFTVVWLDDPALLPPAFHIWTESQIAWFDTRDTLPRHRQKR